MPAATIVHHIPGRIRLRIPARRGDAGYFAELADSVNTMAGIRSFHANPTTASIVMQFDGGMEQLLEQIHERIPDLTINKNDDSVKNSRNIGISPVKLVTGREISPMFMLGSALAAIGLVQTFRGRVAVPSITAFWYALEAFRHSRKR